VIGSHEVGRARATVISAGASVAAGPEPPVAQADITIAAAAVAAAKASRREFLGMAVSLCGVSGAGGR
jgi:hypothetical protein